jgi:hypothetical protein
MCGISGFVEDSNNKWTKEQKLFLIIGLGEGIDRRGEHACGYAAVSSDGNLNYARKKGPWIRARMRFIEGALGDVLLMHARFATCGNREDPMNAHPFAIRRNGKVILWGAHNGMISNADASAKKHGRKITVDSQEIFELIADGDYEGVRDLNGYGVCTWIESNNRKTVNLCRLTVHSDICVVSIKGGGIVWGSTWEIIKNALDFADLEVDKEFVIDDIGMVYHINAEGVFKTNILSLKISAFNRYTKSVLKSSDDEDVAYNLSKEAEQVETKDPGSISLASDKNFEERYREQYGNWYERYSD